MNGLSFPTLRFANMLRLPQFRNKHGDPAHASTDGSDWSPADWFVAFMGEVGEWCAVRVDFEEGRITRAEYTERSAKELADIQTYLDLLAARSLDEVAPHRRTHQVHDVAQQVLTVCATLGMFAEARKKLVRGDVPNDEVTGTRRKILAGQTVREMQELYDMDSELDLSARWPTTYVDPLGVDLGEATRLKWNEVSSRVGSPLRIDVDGRPMGLAAGGMVPPEEC